MIPVVDSFKQLGNYISTNIADRHIIDNIYYLYQRSNWVISEFRVCDSSTLDSLHGTYCIQMYRSELNCNYVKDGSFSGVYYSGFLIELTIPLHII